MTNNTKQAVILLKKVLEQETEQGHINLLLGKEIEQFIKDNSH